MLFARNKESLLEIKKFGVENIVSKVKCKKGRNVFIGFSRFFPLVFQWIFLRFFEMKNDNFLRNRLSCSYFLS